MIETAIAHAWPLVVRLGLGRSPLAAWMVAYVDARIHARGAKLVTS